MGGRSHHMLLVALGGRLWLADVGFGGANPLLPVLLPEGAERYAAPPPGETADAAYAGLAWAAQGELAPALGRMRRFRLRLGAAGERATPDPSTTPHFGQQAGYYLQSQSARTGDWADVYFFRSAASSAAAVSIGSRPACPPAAHLLQRRCPPLPVPCPALPPGTPTPTLRRLDAQLGSDLAMANAALTLNPQSYFVQNTLVSRHTLDGRLTLSNDTFRWEGMACRSVS